MRKLLLFIILSICCHRALSQSTHGTTGLLNIPTAAMQEDGTFSAGGNFLPASFTPSTFSYHTGNYYFNICFLPFLEVTYKMTLIKSRYTDGGYTEQDRSFGVRLRLLKEQQYLPALVLGGNDIYTSGGSVNQYFGSMYAVATKTLAWKENRLGVSIGYGPDLFGKGQLQGVFGGLSYSPSFLKHLELMVDYDTHVFNAGASVLLFNHLYLHAFLSDFNTLVAGAALKFKLY